ncbi:MAG: hypothetical protein LBU81_05835, partial [Methanosarcinales archaeon]|nr:hypothetical protein [Methanosarcinales archaeon]
MTASILILSAASCISIAADGGFGGGSGSLEDPFLIEDADDFKAIQKNLSAHYKLVNDIDLSGSGLRPIGDQSRPFKGSLTGGSDENGLYEISNFEYSSISGPTGLFGWADNARFSNLVLRNFIIEAKDHERGSFLASTINNSTEVVDCTVIDSKLTGWIRLGLVGYANNSMILDCLSEHIQIEGTREIGGILGEGRNTKIINCHSDGILVGKQEVGGVVGYLRGTSSSIDGSSSSCTIKVISEPVTSPAEPRYIGGLAGCVNSTSVTNSFAEGDIEGGSIDGIFNYTGGLVGFSSSGNFKDCYATGDVSVNGSHIGGLIGGSGNSTFLDCSAEGAVKGMGYVGGLLGSSYNDTISECSAKGTVEGMNRIGGLLGSSIQGTISQSSANGTVKGTGDYAGGLIGHSFLDHAISQCSVLEGANVEGVDNVGGLAGTADGPGSSVDDSYKIEGCSVASTVVVKGKDNIGGLVGEIRDVSVTKCDVKGSVEGINSVGGIAGHCSDWVSISECFVSGTTEVTGSSNVGGVAGYCSQSSISGCSVTGDTKVTGSFGVGGLAGYLAAGEITDSYVAGNSIVTGSSNVGGLVGGLVASNLSRSFMAGDVSGNNYVGGLAGLMNIGGYIVSDCYVTGDVLGTGSSIGGLVGDLYAGEIKNSLALNEFVTGSSDVGRIYGSNAGGTLSDTCAWINMSDGSDHFKDGETNVTSADVWRKYPSSGWETSGFGGEWELNTYGDFLLPVHAWTDKNVAANATHLIPKYFIIYNGNG